MSRRHRKRKRILIPDPLYNSELVELFVRQILKNGKKLLAYKIIYDSLNKISEITKKDPLVVLEEAVRNTTPNISLKTRKKRGSNYQIPVEIIPERGFKIAIRWLVATSRRIGGKSMSLILAQELIDASNKMGQTMKKKTDIIKMAEANKIAARK